MSTCIGCGRTEDAPDAAWLTATIAVASESDHVAICSTCVRLLHLSERGLLFGAKTAIHQRFRLRVAVTMMREGGNP